MNTLLRPLSNVFVVVSDDVVLLRDVEARLRASPEVQRVERGPRCMVGCADLPGLPSSQVQTGVASHPGTASDRHEVDGSFGSSAWFAEGLPVQQEDRVRLVNQALVAPEQLHHTPGDFGFIAVDQSEVVVVRSCSGLVPWLTISLPHCQVFSTRNAWLARFLPFAIAPDPLVHAVLSDGMRLPDRRGPYAGSTVLRPGHYWRMRAGGVVREHRYWNPQSLTPSKPSSTKSIREAADELRRRLVGSVERDLDHSGATLLGLSGGIDSSILGSIGSRVLGLDLMALTLTTEPGDAGFERNDRYVKRIVEYIRPTRQWVHPLAQAAMLMSYRTAPTVGLSVPHPALLRLNSLRHEADIKVFTGGESADDLFGGSDHLDGDWVSSIGVRALGRSFFQTPRPVGQRQMLRHFTNNVVHGVGLGRPFTVDQPWALFVSPLAELFSSELRAEFAEICQRWQRRYSLSEDPYELLTLTREEFDGWQLQNWEVCSEFAIRRSIPFHDRSVMELAYGLHPSDHALPAKRLLRTAMNDDVPPEILTRQDKGGSGSASPEADCEIQVSDQVRPLLSTDLVMSDHGSVRISFSAARRIEIVAASIRSAVI
jgi:asparagine synthetase B (glutamine-hydrolysing)